jgi:GTP-binding protein
MRFIDEAKVYVQAGKGGDGVVAFLREKYRPFGGPAGGDGGRGGNVILEVDEGLSTLLDFKYRPRLVARDGEPGRGKQQYGHNGSDLIFRVPPGTIAFDERSGQPLADLIVPKARAIIAHGGGGGRGNMHFVSPTRRTPRIATPGGKGEQRWVRLELRMVSEAGLVGLPNAGKSTLLAALTAARPKIASYPFTTLTPNLGRVKISEEEAFSLADIPGLIEGAHEGHGLGIRFLRHLKRTRVMVYLLALDSDPARDFEVVRGEVAAFDAEMASRHALIALNKDDLVPADDAKQLAQVMRSRTGLDVFVISAREHRGLAPLVAAVARTLQTINTATQPDVSGRL